MQEVKPSAIIAVISKSYDAVNNHDFVSNRHHDTAQKTYSMFLVFYLERQVELVEVEFYQTATFVDG